MGSLVSTLLSLNLKGVKRRDVAHLQSTYLVCMGNLSLIPVSPSGYIHFLSGFNKVFLILKLFKKQRHEGKEMLVGLF